MYLATGNSLLACRTALERRCKLPVLLQEEQVL